MFTAGVAVAAAVLNLVSATSARYDDGWSPPILLGLLSLAATLAYGAGIHALAMRCTSWNRAWLLIIAVTAAAAALAAAAHRASGTVSDWTLRWAAAPVIAVGVVLGLVGGALVRVGGGLLVIEELGRMVIDGATTRTLWLLAAGVGLWLFGHWHHAAKHSLWRSSLGLKAFSLPGLHRLAPIATNHRPRRPGRGDSGWIYDAPPAA
ncbi:hypothetical protein FO059_18130 (plasmid) [Tomitella fengzijianii]|uniref:Uncharacterized protein n=1 Tax=Tomitella fengzijianii TaxID=2597660 RepID=A0A516X8W4_9ACTN|nr:hypothetical protein [Tomitella fengzijianii]QDQ99515.1 hypothetical protein FO059_18130 [Tomitella fengzijianii]